MLTWLSLLALIPSTPVLFDLNPVYLIAQAFQEIVQPQDIRALPGSLDQVPVFNSNSPELVQTEGILLSTFPPDGKATPAAHLDYAFDGRFDLFAHHVARGQSPNDRRTLYLGVIVHNPGNKPVKLNLREAISYLSQEAAFNQLSSSESNLLGNQFSGPGSRTMNDVLRDRRQPQWPVEVEIAPGQDYLLMNVPIPLRRLSVATDGTLAPGSPLLPPLSQQPRANPNSQELPTNARSTLMRLSSDAPVYVASLAKFAPATADGGERVPTLEEWQALLRQGALAGPRDHAPTPPANANTAERFFYGRVAGVAQGSQWVARLTDGARAEQLTLPDRGQRISYVINTVDRNTFGTGQVQSAPMLKRYPDTAYRAHGNYGVEYSLTLPLHNPTDDTQTVDISMQTPLQDETSKEALRFREPADPQIFFRGTVLVLYKDDAGQNRANFLHLVQRRGQQGSSLLRLTLPPGDRRSVQVQFLYPPDATPPQVLTVHTVEQE
ncbi:DUF3370 domain-containing protein [Oculatella sp. LEGE 06141]|uniref:DUF3370 domain-containing protein n=1 Tax=Oculatella sp. LEGE 06141 TaxID=1828648 RepID=UPI00188247E9|nr:DUF3370 domain-containing protein [Oculatella sp. LEGE 06141]MBE9183097.1 DUF3370 domain-containing protein [Oculatella sp. LEGE 06141]